MRSTTSWRRARSLKSQGARVLGDGNPKIGAHGKPVLFLHPKDFCGTLGRDRAGVMSFTTAAPIYFIIWWIVRSPCCRSAVRNANEAGEAVEPGMIRRAYGPGAAGQADLDHDRGEPAVCDRVGALRLPPRHARRSRHAVGVLR